MKAILISILLFVPFALGARYYFVCLTLQWCDRESLELSTGEPMALELPNGSLATLRLPSYQSGSVATPRSPYSLATYDTLAAVLQRNPDELLLVTGPYRLDESTHAMGQFRNLGLARAAQLARELQRRGVSGERLELIGRPVNAGEPLMLKLSLQSRGPEFTLTAIPTEAELLDSTALLGLRFEANSTALTPNEDFIAYAQELVDALAADTSLRLTLVGHTDDRAAPWHNDSLGYHRAQAVAHYLSHIGYTKPIAIETKGERQPIANNQTTEGRYLNRRVEVRID